MLRTQGASVTSLSYPVSPDTLSGHPSTARTSLLEPTPANSLFPLPATFYPLDPSFWDPTIPCIVTPPCSSSVSVSSTWFCSKLLNMRSFTYSWVYTLCIEKIIQGLVWCLDSDVRFINVPYFKMQFIFRLLCLSYKSYITRKIKNSGKF